MSPGGTWFSGWKAPSWPQPWSTGGGTSLASAKTNMPSGSTNPTQPQSSVTNPTSGYASNGNGAGGWGQNYPSSTAPAGYGGQGQSGYDPNSGYGGAGNNVASAAGYGQLYSLGVSSLFLLPYSRSHETEADLMGLDLMASAGFDPRQAIQLWQNMSKQGGGAPPEILSTHPSDETRISNLVERLPHALPLYNAAVAAGKKPKCHV